MIRIALYISILWLPLILGSRSWIDSGTHGYFIGGDYANGIYVNHPLGLNMTPLDTFLCSNIINGVSNSSGTGIGLYTRGWSGVSKLNSISYCDIGHVSDKDDDGLIIFSRYDNNAGPGLLLTTGRNQISLAGSHSGGDDYAAFNKIYGNNSSSSSTSAQIVIEQEDKFTQSPVLILGTDSDDPDDYDTYGQNNIIGNSDEDNLIFTSIPDYSIDKINQNYWGFGTILSPTAYSLTSSNYPTLLVGITYPATDPVCSASLNVPSFDVNCGIGFDRTKRDFQYPSSMSERVFDAKECYNLYDKGVDYVIATLYAKAYDTLKYFIENCSPVDMYGRTAGIGFSPLTNANAGRSTDLGRFAEHREWLKTVLFLSNDSSYYCSAATAILATFSYYEPINGADFKAEESILRYIDSSGKCPGFYKYHIDGIRKYYYDTYRDTCMDTSASPFDTTNFPSLEELDLTILYGPQGSVSPVAEMRIGTLTASPNPFGENLELRYDLIKSAMVRIDVFDILGKTIYESPQGFKEKGEHQLTIPTQWTSGTYYIRLSTPTGEVKSVKVIKE